MLPHSQATDSESLRAYIIHYDSDDILKLCPEDEAAQTVRCTKSTFRVYRSEICAKNNTDGGNKAAKNCDPNSQILGLWFVDVQDQAKKEVEVE